MVFNNDRPLDNGGGPPDDPRMEERVKKLEELAEQARTELRSIDTRLTKIETRMEAFATKGDIGDTKAAIAEAKSAIIIWVVGAIFVAQLLPMLKDFVKPTTPFSTPTVQAPVPAPKP